MNLHHLPNIAPSRSTRLSVRHPVRVMRFGGGHTRYLRHGHLKSEARWAVHWAGLTPDQLAQLHRFFEHRQGTEAFFWTPPYDEKPQPFVCLEWSMTPLQGGFHHLDAVLIRR